MATAIEFGKEFPSRDEIDKILKMRFCNLVIMIKRNHKNKVLLPISALVGEITVIVGSETKVRNTVTIQLGCLFFIRCLRTVE
jgi:hypothetical protein